MDRNTTVRGFPFWVPVDLQNSETLTFLVENFGQEAETNPNARWSFCDRGGLVIFFAVKADAALFALFKLWEA